MPLLVFWEITPCGLEAGNWTKAVVCTECRSLPTSPHRVTNPDDQHQRLHRRQNFKPRNRTKTAFILSKRKSRVQLPLSSFITTCPIIIPLVQWPRSRASKWSVPSLNSPSRLVSDRQFRSLWMRLLLRILYTILRISSSPVITVTPPWLVRQRVVCDNRTYHKQGRSALVQERHKEKHLQLTAYVTLQCPQNFILVIKAIFLSRNLFF
jgi:hypothetical protein